MKKVRAPRIAVLGFLAAGCSAPVVSEGSADPQAVIELQPYVGGLVTADVEIAGARHKLLFDSGGGWTMISPEFATEIECKPHDRIVGSRMTGEPFKTEKCGAQDISIIGVGEKNWMTKDDIGVFDLAALLPPEFPRVDGVLSLATLRTAPITLDLDQRKLIVETPKSLEQRTKGLEARRVRIAREGAGYGVTAFVEAGGGPEPFWFLMDSGNLDADLMPAETADVIFDAAEGKESRDAGDLFQANFVISGNEVNGVSARVKPIIYDGAIGAEVLRHYVVTIDFANEKMWMAPRQD